MTKFREKYRHAILSFELVLRTKSVRVVPGKTHILIITRIQDPHLYEKFKKILSTEN